MAKCITEGCDNEAIEGAVRCKECRNKMNESKGKKFDNNLKKFGITVGCAIAAATVVAVAKSGDSA